MTSDKPPKKRTRWWLWCLALILLGTVALVGVCFGYRHYWRSRVDAQLDIIRQAGYPATLKDLDAWYEYPKGENAAEAYAEAYRAYTAPDERDEEHLVFFGGRGETARRELLSEASKQAAVRFLGSNAKALKLLHKASEIRRCRFPTDLTRGLMTSGDHFDGLFRCSRLLNVDAILQAATGRTSEAVRSIRSSMALSQALDSEPVLISQLVRLAMQTMVIQALDRVVNSATVSDAELLSMVASLPSENSNGMLRAMVGEMCCGSAAFSLPIDVMGSSDDGTVPAEGLPWQLYRASGLLDRDRAFYLTAMMRFVRVAEKPFPGRLAASREARAWLDEQESEKLFGFSSVPKHPISHLLLGALHRAFVEEGAGSVQLRAARVGLTIELFRLKHGKLPAKLSDLVPEYIKAIPADPFDGKPLRFKKLDKGYVLYSVGENGEDDGGSDEKDEHGLWRNDDITFTVKR